MNELDDRSEFKPLRSLLAESICEQQHQLRAHALAAGMNDVVANLVNQGYI